MVVPGAAEKRQILSFDEFLPRLVHFSNYRKNYSTGFKKLWVPFRRTRNLFVAKTWNNIYFTPSDKFNIKEIHGNFTIVTNERKQVHSRVNRYSMDFLTDIKQFSSWINTLCKSYYHIDWYCFLEQHIWLMWRINSFFCKTSTNPKLFRLSCLLRNERSKATTKA